VEDRHSATDDRHEKRACRPYRGCVVTVGIGLGSGGGFAARPVAENACRGSRARRVLLAPVFGAGGRIGTPERRVSRFESPREDLRLGRQFDAGNRQGGHFGHVTATREVRANRCHTFQKGLERSKALHIPTGVPEKQRCRSEVVHLQAGSRTETKIRSRRVYGKDELDAPSVWQPLREAAF